MEAKALVDRPVLLVDADTILFRAGFAAEKTHYLVETYGDFVKADSHREARALVEEADKHGFPGATIWSHREVGPVKAALSNAQAALNGILGRYNPKDTRLFLTGRGNFRDTLAVSKEYKGNRDPAHRPRHYQALRSWFIEAGAQIIVGFEADDAIGAAAYGLSEHEYVVVSNDKDLDQIPGHHFDWTTGNEWYISPQDAMRVFYTQVLCGDPTDNIPGIMSEKKAFDLVSSCDSPYRIAGKVVEAYMKKYEDPEIVATKLAEIGNLVWIKRSLNEGQDGFTPPMAEHLKDVPLVAENGDEFEQVGL